MNHLIKLSVFVLILSTSLPGSTQNSIPALVTKDSIVHLYVDGKPFLMLAGELGNSTATTVENMVPVWPKLKAMNLNTVLVPVYWELIEQEEGKFDFSLYEQLITEARNNNMKIVFLWFGSWKNSMSSHAPAWIKLNQEKYPRVKDDNNKSQEILNPFSANNLLADTRAFEKLVSFIKEYDKVNHTVLMIQVENEIGMLPSARDYSPAANEAFKKDVPAELIRYLQANKNNLASSLREQWTKNGSKTSGNWEAVFGKSVATDEIFMAWYFSVFTNKLAAAGKAIYPIPMFVNAALNRPGKEPGKGYPSAGPLPHLMDVWKAAGNAIDLLCPDFYNPSFKQWNDLYVRQGDPLFIPEHKFDSTAAFKAMYAIGHYQALGFSPFSIESVEDPVNAPLGKVYSMLGQLSPMILSSNKPETMEAVLLDKVHQDTVIKMGAYKLTIKHDYTLGWSPGAKAERWPMTGAIIIRTGENEFYVAGSGVVITFKPGLNESLNVGILKTDEGSFENNNWKTLRHLNGDETHQGRHIRISEGTYGIQRVKLYTYE
jgi:hypothetical protein